MREGSGSELYHTCRNFLKALVPHPYFELPHQNFSFPQTSFLHLNEHPPGACEITFLIHLVWKRWWVAGRHITYSMRRRGSYLPLRRPKDWGNWFKSIGKTQRSVFTLTTPRTFSPSCPLDSLGLSHLAQSPSFALLPSLSLSRGWITSSLHGSLAIKEMIDKKENS